MLAAVAAVPASAAVTSNIASRPDRTFVTNGQVKTIVRNGDTIYVKLSAAERRIRVRHCRVGRVTRKFSTARQRNRVLKQAPNAGRRFAAGHKVTLVVGKGPRKR